MVVHINFGLKDVEEDLHAMHNESFHVNDDLNATYAIEPNEIEVEAPIA